MRGLGIDIIEVNRIRAITSRYGLRFLRRIYTQRELAYCRTPAGEHRYTSLAARFAAKEAFYKAVFPQLQQPISWQDCEVTNDDDQVPSLKLSVQLNKRLNQPQILLSLSHCENYAVAIVVIE